MIDDGELDWKVIAIHAEDPLAKELHDIHDVESKLHGTVSGEYYYHSGIEKKTNTDRVLILQEYVNGFDGTKHLMTNH